MKSVLQEWVMKLPLKQQATLISALRGPDNLHKDNIGKQLTRYLRNLVLIPANPEWKDNPEDTFFRYKENTIDECFKSFVNNHDEYPHHFIMHLVHAFEIVGYQYYSNSPKENNTIEAYEHAERCFQFYERMCVGFHMAIETKREMNERLSI